MHSAASILVLIACAYVEAHPLTPEQLAVLTRNYESELPAASSNELNSIYDDIAENDKYELSKKFRILERIKEMARASEHGYEIEHPPEVPVPRDNNLQRESRRQQGPYMTLCHFKICNMGKKRSRLHSQ